jgi:hypothetical protein
VPLLLVTVAKSGQHLALASLNALLVLRHYCFALPIHYLCCSCNLFVCLRWLSWCCCCCCCNYLCCLADNKQKCCDSRSAPKLKLHHRRHPNRASGTKRRRLKENDDSDRQAAEATSTFVIGFNTNNSLAKPARQGECERRASRRSVRYGLHEKRPITVRLVLTETTQLNDQPAANEQQKSVRFVGDTFNESTTDDSESDLNVAAGQHHHTDDEPPLDELESRRLLVSSLIVLAAYVALGALYHASKHDSSLVDALFACYSMLATSKLPESFQLDAAREDPIQFYRNHLAEVRQPGASGAQSSQPANPNQPGRRQSKSEDVGLILDSIYLLVGLNLIAACAQFARLWLNGTVSGRLRAGCQTVAPNKGPPSPPARCNGSQPPMSSSSSLMGGSFEHQGGSQFVAVGAGVPASVPPSIRHLQQDYGERAYETQYVLGSAAIAGPPNAPAASTGLGGGQSQINLSDLFVLGPDSAAAARDEPPSESPVGQPVYHAHQLSDGASFGSSSSQAGPRSAASLCAHHQSEMGQPQQQQQQQQQQPHQLQTLAVGHAELSDCSSNSAAPAKLRHCSSSIQLFEVPAGMHEPSAYPSPPYNSSTLTRRPPGGQHHQKQHHSHNHQHQHQLRHQHQHHSNGPLVDQTTAIITNGFGGPIPNGGLARNELDSSPNTLDTNSQTISSSASARAIVMRPIRLQAGAQQSAGEKTVSWLQADESCQNN